RVLAQDRALPLAAELVGLFPESGLRRGSTVVVNPGSAPGSTGLALALLSGPSSQGSWCAVVGHPDLGLVAASQLGADLGHIALVPHPGKNWAVVTAALLEGMDVVLLCTSHFVPPQRVGAPHARRLEARAREQGSVLVVLGEDWPGNADVRLSVVANRWHGLGDGFGYLAGGQLEVAAGGRGAASRPRRAAVRLGVDGLGIFAGASFATLSPGTQGASGDRRQPAHAAKGGAGCS
ncbi:MAG TPA: hypothetical protein VL984_03215, partial [Acidimicrobiales bacterium]|nr:hypothetical protein [Acidimicrobiales bacterium]